MTSKSQPVALTCLLFLFLFSCQPGKKKPSVFQIERGFQIDLVASEPLIRDVIDLEFDETGCAFVLEMPGYPMEDVQSKVKVLTDINNDGVYDKQSLFADNLLMASSIMPYKKGLLIAAPPYLLFARDENRDYHADAIDTLMGGFATGNLQHNFNGLTYNFDNWIYCANGGNSGKPYWWGDTLTTMDLRGQDFRFNLDRKVMERIGESSGGFGLAMDEYGHLFGTHNLHHVSNLVFPDYYKSDRQLSIENTLLNISDHEENGLARVYPIGEQESRVNHPEQSGYFSGSCGITYYESGALGKAYDRSIWVADVVLNLVHVDKLQPQGAAFVASRVLDKREFLASKDRSFRPVNMAVGPDGAMYLVDMYRRVIEHPEWIPDDIEKTLNLNEGKDKGRIYRISKTGSDRNDFSASSFNTLEGLLQSLSSQNQWIKNTAHRLLMDRPLNENENKEVAKNLVAESDLARLHSMWILECKGVLTPAQLLKALEDVSDGVRENALKIAELHFDDAAVRTKSIELMGDAAQRVRMQAALSMSTLSESKYQQSKGAIIQGIVSSAVKPMDQWNVEALALVSKNWPAEVFSKLVPTVGDTMRQKLFASLAFAAGNDTQQAGLILEAIVKATFDVALRKKLIDNLLRNLSSTNEARTLLPSIQALEASGNIDLVSSLANMRVKLHLPMSAQFDRLSDLALKDILNRSLPDSVRKSQLELIATLPYRRKANVLFECIKNTEPIGLQKGALLQLSTSTDQEIGRKLVSQWQELGPQARQWASDLLLYIEIHHDALLTGLEQGVINIGEMNFDLERRRMLLVWTDDKATQARAKKLFTDSGVTTRREAMEKMKDALMLTGLSSNGATIFQKNCALCHVYGALGNDVGPVLTEINRKSKASMMHDILDPNAAVNTQYINHRLETRAGVVHFGIIKEETDRYLTIRKMGGETITVAKGEIKRFSSTGSSLMSEGLEQNMTPQEMADLLAFLQNGK